MNLTIGFFAIPLFYALGTYIFVMCYQLRPYTDKVDKILGSFLGFVGFFCIFLGTMILTGALPN